MPPGGWVSQRDLFARFEVQILSSIYRDGHAVLARTDLDGRSFDPRFNVYVPGAPCRYHLMTRPHDRRFTTRNTDRDFDDLGEALAAWDALGKD